MPSIDSLGVPYNSRFFYFKSLLNKNPSIAQQISSPTGAINFFGGEQFDDQSFLKSTMASLELLSNMADFHRGNEIRLIQEKIIPLVETFNGGKYKDLAKCIDGDTIDYIKFMSLIKLLEDDSKEALAELNDFYDKTQKFSDLAKEIIGNKSYTEIKQQRAQIVATVRATATEDLTTDLADRMAALNQYNKARETEDNKELFQALEDNILPMIQGGRTTIEIPMADNAYQTRMLNYIIMLCKQREKAINQDKQNMKTSLLNFLTTEQDAETIDLLQRYSDRLLTSIDTLESEGEAFEKKINQMSDKIYIGRNGQIAGLTKSVRAKLSHAIKNKEGLQAITNKKMTISVQVNGKTIEKEIDATTRTKANKDQYIDFIIDDIFTEEEKKNLTQQQIVDELNKLVKQADQRKETITIASEHSSGGFWGAITNAITTKIVGAFNRKNDASLVTIGKAFISTSKGKSVSKEQYDQGIQAISKVTDNMADNFHGLYKFYLNEDATSKDQKRNQNTFDIIAQTKADAKTTQIALDQMKKELEKLHLKINDVSDLFQIDDSAKFAETFMLPEGGFAGGSLGTDVLSQVNNINNMMIKGGLTPLDAERLTSMIINAGDGMIGAAGRSAVENYLTSIGSMLMFQSGGTALEQWKSQIDNMASTSTTKIHIYTFGPMYVPESFILQRTYEALKQCVSLLENEVDSVTTGSAVRIYNPVTEADMVRDNHGRPDWEATANKNYPRVKLDMVLMGGFLDVMQQMVSIMNSAISG